MNFFEQELAKIFGEGNVISVLNLPEVVVLGALAMIYECKRNL